MYIQPIRNWNGNSAKFGSDVDSLEHDVGVEEMGVGKVSGHPSPSSCYKR